MKASTLIEVKVKTGKELQQVEMPEVFHREVKEYLETFGKLKPKYVALIKPEDKLYRSSVDDTDELVFKVKTFDTKYVYETELRIFYKVV